MGITKQYLRYGGIASFGLVGTGSCIRYLVRYNEPGKFVAAAACEDVFIWNIRTGRKIVTLNSGNRSLVTTFEVRPSVGGTLDNSHIAVGYIDGLVSVFEISTGTATEFKAFKRGVSTLSWDKQGMNLACGSQDGEIVTWDMLTQMGIVRLKGHKGMINKLEYMKERNILISSSRDTFVKFWNLDTNHCFYTLVENKVEVMEFVLIKKDSMMVTGCKNGSLNVWALQFNDRQIMKIKEEPKDDFEENEPSQKHIVLQDGLKYDIPSFESIKKEDLDIEDDLKVERKGEMSRYRTDRILNLASDGKSIVCIGKSSFVDFYTILDDDEVDKRRQKRLSKTRKRNRDYSSENDNDFGAITIKDEIRKIQALDAGKNISAIDVYTSRVGQIRVICLYKSENYVKSIVMNPVSNKESGGQSPYSEEYVVARPSHRKEVRAVAFNSTSDQLITASGDSIKVWHRESNQTMLTITINGALCMITPPGDKHVVIGTKSGKIEMYDLRSGDCIQETQGHDTSEDGDTGTLALDLLHDKKGFVSGGADAKLKFWSFELVTENEERRLAFVLNKKGVTASDSIIGVRCSQNGKHVIVAKMDLTETIYYTDTLHVCHELYGKSMPATCVDFSSDSTIVVTGSRDSCLRIYDVNHGDQKKMLKNAHTGGVMDVRFIPRTHMFFSCGTDGTVKQWDADIFQRIVTLKGHFGIVGCMAIDYKGHWVASCGQDRSIRLWEKTEEPLVLEDERAREREKAEDEELGVLEKVVIGEHGAEAVRPSMLTRDTEQWVDQLVEAIDIYLEQKEILQPNQLMNLVYNTKDPLKFMLLVIQKIKPSEMDETILMLPLNYIIELLYILKEIIEKDLDDELPCRMSIFAVRVNFTYLVAATKAKPVLKILSELVPTKLEEIEHEYRFIIAGLTHMKERYERRDENIYSENILKVLKKRNKRMYK